MIMMEFGLKCYPVVICFPFSATRDPSNLLAHEAAFALGQMQDAEAIPVLEGILKDMSLHPIVRHEVDYLLCIIAILF